MAPFNLNNKYVEMNSSKIIAFRNYLVNKKIADEDLQRDEMCHQILKEIFARAQIGPSAYNSLRSYMKDQGGVRRYLQQPIWRASPSLGVAMFNKRIQNSVPRESDFQQISTAQTKSLVQELFDGKGVDEDIIKKFRALSKLMTNAECEQLVPKRLSNQNKTEVIQYLREYMEKSKQEEEGKKGENESDEEHYENRRKVKQDNDSHGYASSEIKADLAELNEVMGKLLSGDNVEFLTYAMAVHSTFLKAYANLQKWDRLLSQRFNGDHFSADPDESLASRCDKHERKSHRRSLPSKH